jgi:hypothetical protein
MATWVSILADVRTDLKDSGASPRWPDAALWLWLRDAVADSSRYFPLRVSRHELTLTAGAYPLPADLVEIVSVECPQDTHLERIRQRPGIAIVSSGSPKSFYTEGSTLYLDGAPSDPVLLTYEALHPIGDTAPAPEDTTETTVPKQDLELLRLYVKAKANEQVRSQQANLDRFKLGAGDRDDNPLIPEVTNLMREYRDKINARIPSRAIRLYRSGMRR